MHISLLLESTMKQLESKVAMMGRSKSDLQKRATSYANIFGIPKNYVQGLYFQTLYFTDEELKECAEKALAWKATQELQCKYFRKLIRQKRAEIKETMK